MAAFILPGECEASGLKFTFWFHLLERVIKVTCVSSSRDLVQVLNFVLPCILLFDTVLCLEIFCFRAFLLLLHLVSSL